MPTCLSCGYGTSSWENFDLHDCNLVIKQGAKECRLLRKASKQERKAWKKQYKNGTRRDDE